MPIHPESSDSVLQFWFDELQPAQWWKIDRVLDQLMAARFDAVHTAAAQCELAAWRSEPRGALAEVIVLDQFSRNIHRGEAAAFACDRMALTLAQVAVTRGFDQLLPVEQRAFLYLPYMHSESVLIHAEALALFSVPGLEPNLRSELQHKTIIDRFGRYPHRNQILGRVSTSEEIAFLAQPGSSF